MKKPTIFAVLICSSLLWVGTAWSQPGAGRGRGAGFPGRGAGGHGHDERHAADQQVFHFLLENHERITRTVTELQNGVETLTESEVPAIADKIKEHVEWMQYRIENTNPIRMRDPLFAEIFRQTDKIKMIHEDTEKGVKVTETSDDPYVAKLIQAHAKAVSGFVERGFAEAMKNHAIPSDKQTTSSDKQTTRSDQQTTSTGLIHPVIAEHGGVVRLADAAMQPRGGARLLVDLTSGGDPAKLNSAIEKVAKYLNIYGGAGAVPKKAQIAVVFHGDATLAVLNSDAYAKNFDTKGNPNFALLRQLHENNVDLYVCGQSLIAKGATPEDVVVFVDTAVSALTAVVNLQADGYAYLPLGK